MADIAHVGLSVLTVYDERVGAPEALENELIEMAWARARTLSMTSNR